MARRGRRLSGDTWCALVLMLLALLLLAPAVLTLLTTTAQFSEEELITRLRMVEQHARADRQVYTLLFRPNAGTVEVLRYHPARGRDAAVSVRVPALSFVLSNDTVVQGSSFPQHRLTIGAHGAPLTPGRITLRAVDGTHTQVRVGEAE
jgi:hypothetical protein